MKNIILLVASLMFLTAVKAQEHSSANEKIPPENQIEKYWFVMIRTGPKNDFDSTTRSNLFKGHMDNIKRLYDEGKLKVAGPFDKNDFQWRGIFILDCATKEEAEKLVQSDPAIAAGIFSVDIVPWYTSPMGSFKKGKPEKAKP